MAWRTATGKILLALAGTVGVALVVFVVVLWLQAPPPPASPDEIIQEVMEPPGENGGEAIDEADAVAGVLPASEEIVSPALGPVAQPVEEGGEDQEVVGVLPAPLTPDEVAGAMLAPSVPDEEGGDEAAVRDAVEAAVNQFAAAVLERLDEIVHASAGSPDAVVMASAPSVEEDEEETPGPVPQQVMEPVAAASTGSPPGAPVAPEVPAPPRGPLETPAHEPDRDAAAAQRPFVLPVAGLAELRRPEPVAAPHVPRGVMGYRMPLVSRQELPIQVVSGVVMPAHHTYVILRPGHWELLMEGGEIVLPAEPVEAVIEEPPARRRWSLFDLFRKRTPASEE